jgi:hypothetical protein
MAAKRTEKFWNGNDFLDLGQLAWPVGHFAGLSQRA